MLENSTIKEHYIKIQELYNNVINILTAINQSFHTTASEVTVNYVDNDDITQVVRIPSFLYLENKLEQLDTNFSNLFNMPKSGEAWFTKSADMYKLELVKSNNAPLQPILNTNNILAYSKDTNVLKDIVNPKTFLKIDINNLPDNIEQVLMKKLVFFDANIYNQILDSNVKTYDDYKALLFNLTKGVDYDEYESIIDLPVKEDEYVSEFKIIDIPELESNNPYVEELSNRVIYRVILDNIAYHKESDSSIEYSLQPGQYLCLNNEYVIYKILEVNKTTNNEFQNELILEEVLGHVALQSYEENSNMILYLYNQNYNKFHYIELPLEENPYIAVFLSTIYNNTRSIYSDALLLNLNDVKMVGPDGQLLISDGKEVSYIDYYNKYCQNIGDLILGISEVAYTQVSNYSMQQLSDLQNSDAIKALVSQTISNEYLNVQRINTHLIDDEYKTKIINLHKKRTELYADIDTIQTDIDSTYSQIINSDYENDDTVSQLSLNHKLTELYNNKIDKQKSLISVINDISILKTDIYGTAAPKYRIRGNVNTDIFEDYLKQNYIKANIVQMEVQYKYKSITSDTTNVSDINSSLFTDWNKLMTIERERKLVFDSFLHTYTIDYETYNDITNIIKWNQIEIPITPGEDVIIRVRYKYSIGQPFINLYSPWSNEVTVQFPEQFVNSLDLTNIIEQNDDDEIEARFMRTLINDGYLEHVSNKVIDNAQTFYHMPENIYSGFNTPENNLISLKDKLQSMTNELNKYKEIIDVDSVTSYEVYLSIDNEIYELFQNADNEILIGDISDSSTKQIITKNINLVIKNTGETPLKLYSIFPGNPKKKLIELNNSLAKKLNTLPYETVPILVEGNNAISKKAYEVVQYQTLGQVLYFREDSIYNTELYYLDDNDALENIGLAVESESKNNPDSEENIFDHINYYNTVYGSKTYINYNLLGSRQLPLIPRYRENNYDAILFEKAYKPTLSYNYDSDTGTFSGISEENNHFTVSNELITGTYNKASYDSDTLYDGYNFDSFKSNDDFTSTSSILGNRFIFKYEHIWGTKTDSGDLVQLSKDIISKENFGSNYTFNLKGYEYKDTSIYTALYGGFLIPSLKTKKQIICKDEDNSYTIVNIGDSISIPITFEYFLDNSNSSTLSQYQSVSKTLSFDIKKSLFENPRNYTFTVKASVVNETIISSNSYEEE